MPKFRTGKPKQWAERHCIQVCGAEEDHRQVIILWVFVTTYNPFHIQVVMWSTVTIKILIIAALKRYIALLTTVLCFYSGFCLLIPPHFLSGFTLLLPKLWFYYFTLVDGQNCLTDILDVDTFYSLEAWNMSFYFDPTQPLSQSSTLSQSPLLERAHA